MALALWKAQSISRREKVLEALMRPGLEYDNLVMPDWIGEQPDDLRAWDHWLGNQ